MELATEQIKMADTLPINFPLPPESSIASYDYFDLADGTGLKQYYCGAGANSTITIGDNFGHISSIADGILFDNPFYAELAAGKGDLHVTSANTSDGMSITLTFDLAPFNIPRIIGGFAYLQLSVYRNNTGTNTSQFSAVYQKVASGGGTTDLNTTTQFTFAKNQSSTKFVRQQLTQTAFARGDKLRLVITITLSPAVPSATGLIYAVGIDPKNRDGTYLIPSSAPNFPTILTTWIPFKIE